MTSMLFCHRGSKASTPPSPSQKPHELPTSRYRNSEINDVDTEEWQLPSILTAGSLDELTASNSLLPQAPVMPPILEAQLATLSNREANGKTNGSTGRSSSNRRSQLLSSASMHSLVSSVTSQDYTLGLGSKKGGSSIFSNVVDGNLSLPITHKKHHHYSGLSLLSLSHHRSGSSTLGKVRSLHAQQFSSLLDFEERYNDPWVGSITLRRTAKPNLENERHRENSLFLSILEAKGLHNKRRYYCDVCLDRTLYARSTSKQSTGNSIFWAEEFDLNNLPDVSILTVSLYREADGGGRDGRRGILTRSNSKKSSKKSQNRLVGFVTLPVMNVCTRNPSQTWLTLQPPANADSMNPMLISSSEIGDSNFTVGSNCSTGFIPTANSNNTPQGIGVQLRVSVRYKSVDILPISVYIPLHTLVRENGIEMTEWFEHLIPLKLKEEVASCLVNLHERGGTATAFLTELVVREVSDLENESMTFRSNTMATKAVESYIKLVGKEYLHSLLHRFIQRVLVCPDTWEVDPDKLSPSNLSAGSLLSPDGRGTSTTATRIIQDYCSRKRNVITNSSCSDTPGNGLSRLAVLNNGRVAQPGSLVYSQTQLLQHLDLVWEAVCASLPNFPKPLLDVFSSFRAALEPSKGAEFCDKLISACIFLRFVCPAILTPSLFGLASTFPGESNCQRNLTLVAKSLQSLANLSTFGDKEFFMRFMNAYVEAQIPVMRRFLRDISSLPGVLERSTTEHTTSPVASNIDCGYELACLQNICQEILNPPNGQQNPSSTSSIFPSGNTTSPTESLPPSLSRLPKIIAHLENLKNGIGLPASDFIEGRVTSDSSYASVNSTKRLPALAMPYATSSSVKSDILNPLPRFYLPMEESTSDFSSASVPRQSIPDLNTIGSPIAKPKAVRPTTVRLPGSDGYQHQSNLSDVVMTSPKKTIPFGDDEADDRVTMRELLKGSAFRRNSGGGRHDVDYDDPYIEEAYDSTHVSRRRTTYDAPYEGEDKSGGSGGQMTSSSGASPVHVLQFPSPPYSAFSLYRRPFVPNSPEALQMECSTSSPLTAPPAPPQINTLAISRSSSGIASAEQSSPRKTHQHHGNHHHHATVARDPLKTTTSTTPSNSENVILEPRPNPIITHFRPHLSRSSTASSSLTNNNKQESSTTSTTQHHYPYRQVTNASLAINHPPPTVTSLIATPTKSTTTARKKSSSIVGTSIFPMDYDFGDYYAGQVAIDDMGTMGTSSSSWNFETDNRRQLSVKKNNEQSEASCYGPTQPVPAENEQLLTSTLEELGDAVAWLERERNDLLSMQERRMSNNRSRSRPTQSPNYAPLTLPSKGPSLTVQTPIVSEINPPTSKTTQLRLHPHTSTPSLHWLNYNPDESSILTKSTNSLIEPTHPQHKAHRSAVSKTFTLTRSGSASVSPRRSRESSDSSDTHPTVPVRRQRTTTLVLSKPSAPGVATTVVGNNGPVHRSSPQTPVGIRRLSNKNDCSDELEFVVLHPHRPRPHPPSYVSTSNCNIFTPNNASQNQSTSQSSTTQRRTTGGVYILSSSPLTS